MKVISFVHVSLDGFVAGPKGEMDWIIHDDSLMDFVSKRISQTDAAMYGRKTFELMESYWPTAGDQPNAKESTKEHAKWYKKIDKYVLSNTINSDASRHVHVIGKDLVKDINAIKTRPGKEILIFGSPGATHALQQLDLVDGYWMFLNPTVVGKGLPLFGHAGKLSKFKLEKSHTFENGVVSVSYSK